MEDRARILLLRFAGSLCLVAAVIAAALVAVNRTARLNGGHDLRFLLVLFGLGLVAGVGLILRRKWSVVMVLVAVSVFVFPFVLGVLESPGPWTLLGLVLSVGSGGVIVAPLVWTWPACRDGI